MHHNLSHHWFANESLITTFSSASSSFGDQMSGRHRPRSFTDSSMASDACILGRPVKGSTATCGQRVAGAISIKGLARRRECCPRDCSEHSQSMRSMYEDGVSEQSTERPDRFTEQPRIPAHRNKSHTHAVPIGRGNSREARWTRGATIPRWTRGKSSAFYFLVPAVLDRNPFPLYKAKEGEGRKKTTTQSVRIGYYSRPTTGGGHSSGFVPVRLE